MVQHQYNGIYLVGRSRIKGSLGLDDQSIRWKAQYVSKSVNVAADEVMDLHWAQVGQQYQVKIVLQSGAHVRFQGFLKKDFEVFEAFSKSAIGKSMELVDYATNGWNWGNFDFKSSSMRFLVDDKLAFELPFSDISQSVIQGKNEISLEFHQDDTAQPEDENLVEMRFFVPPSHKLEGISSVRDTQEDDTETNNSNSADNAAIESIHNEILNRAELGESADESIASFGDIMFVTPRGRFDIEIFPTFFKLHGKSYSYKILYKSVNRLFQLPKSQGQSAFIISLDPAIRQGHTTHSFLQLNFKDDEEIELKPNLDAETLRKRFDGKLSESMVGPHCDIFGQVFSAFTGRKINKPSTSYVPDSDEVGIRCSFKAQEGLLFLLERSFFYLPKPPMFIRHEEIASVEFLRVGVSATGQSSKTFDVIFNHRNNDTHFLFTGIFRDDYKPIVDYFQAKNIAILNLQEIMSQPPATTITRSGRVSTVKGEGLILEDLPDEEESEDEDFKLDGGSDESGESSEEEEDAENEEEEDEEEEETSHEKTSSKQVEKRKGSSDKTKPQSSSKKTKLEIDETHS